jgi:hypothetical protein
MLIAVAGADAAALGLLRRAPAQAVRGLGHVRSWFAAVGSDRAVATLAEAALWFAAAWVALGLACCLIARLPGTLGAAGAAVGGMLLPRLLLRLVAGSAGLGVLVAPVAAVAHPPPPRPAPTSASAPALPGPIWPSNASPPTVAGPRWPTQQVAHPPPARPRPAAPDPTTEHAPPSRPADTVRVRTGDSLWLLAAQRLGPRADDARIAAEWPRWYAANRDVVGPDPDHIVPGQVLHAPAASLEER